MIFLSEQGMLGPLIIKTAKLNVVRLLVHQMETCYQQLHRSFSAAKQAHVVDAFRYGSLPPVQYLYAPQ